MADQMSSDMIFLLKGPTKFCVMSVSHLLYDILIVDFIAELACLFFTKAIIVHAI